MHNNNKTYNNLNNNSNTVFVPYSTSIYFEFLIYLRAIDYFYNSDVILKMCAGITETKTQEQVFEPVLTIMCQCN